MRPERQLAALDHLAKDRLVMQERPSHPEPLRALSGKNKSHFFSSAKSFAPGRKTGASLVLKESLQPFYKLLRRIAAHAEAIVAMTAARARAVTNVMQR